MNICGNKLAYKYVNIMTLFAVATGRDPFAIVALLEGFCKANLICFNVSGMYLRGSWSECRNYKYVCVHTTVRWGGLKTKKWLCRVLEMYSIQVPTAKPFFPFF